MARVDGDWRRGFSETEMRALTAHRNSRGGSSLFLASAIAAIARVDGALARRFQRDRNAR